MARLAVVARLPHGRRLKAAAIIPHAQAHLAIAPSFQLDAHLRCCGVLTYVIQCLLR
jgi:hypothetical protein